MDDYRDIDITETTPPPGDRTYRITMEMTGRDVAMLVDAVRNHRHPMHIALAEEWSRKRMVGQRKRG